MSTASPKKLRLAFFFYGINIIMIAPNFRVRKRGKKREVVKREHGGI